jgi:Tol biopolymer transport system component
MGRSRILMGAVAASLAIVTSGCTAGAGAGMTTPRSTKGVAVALSASATPASKVVFVDVRTRSVRPLPSALTAFEEASDYHRSPDGEGFVFQADVEDGSSHQLFLGSVDGSDVRQLTDEPLAATGGRWSPDGSRIVFLSGGFLTSRLKVIDVASGEVERVHGVPRGVWAPSFSPDGRSILFSMAISTPRDGWRVDMWTVPERGGTPRRLIRYGGYAAYSPDGSTIAYHRTTPQPSAFCGKCWWVEGGLSVADSDGREELGMSQGGMIAPPQAHRTSGARWSPDGSSLMHTGVTGVNGRADIVVRDLRSGEVARLGAGLWPTWFDDRTVVVTR